jgi:hypothetical protein
MPTAAADLLFDTPWWLPVAIVAVGVFVFVRGNRRQKKGVLFGGLGVAVLGVVVALVSYFVDTAKEQAARRASELVGSVNTRDWPKFTALLDRQTNVYGVRGPDAITLIARTVSERNRLGISRITGMEVKQADPTFITVDMRVLSDIAGTSVISDWQLQFERLSQGWVLKEVRALSNQQIREERIKSEISRQQ